MKKSSKRNKLIIIGAIIAALLLLVLLGFTITRILVPERSIASFCTYRKAHDADFRERQDYAKIASLYAGLERVSPDEVRPDVAAIQKRYHEIASDPTNTGTIGLSLLQESAAVHHYTQQNCAK